MKGKQKQRELIVEIMKADEQSGLYDEPRVKLYTEEQVREMMQDSFNFGDKAIDYAVSRMTPIELPSDEEINAYVESTPYYGSCTEEYKEGIDDGAKWVIEQIKKQK